MEVDVVVGGRRVCGMRHDLMRRRCQPVCGHFSMDRHWKFYLGDPPKAKEAAFDDSAWREIDLPHDWSIEGRIGKTNPAGSGGGFFPTGVGWYRRTFTAPQAWQGRRVAVDFEGVYMNANVYLNGHHLGAHFYGYTSFFLDLTPDLKFAAANVLAVRVDNSRQGNSRWYSGSGIDRHMSAHDHRSAARGAVGRICRDPRGFCAAGHGGGANASGQRRAGDDGNAPHALA